MNKFNLFQNLFDDLYEEINSLDFIDNGHNMLTLDNWGTDNFGNNIYYFSVNRNKIVGYEYFMASLASMIVMLYEKQDSHAIISTTSYIGETPPLRGRYINIELKYSTFDSSFIRVEMIGNTIEEKVRNVYMQLYQFYKENVIEKYEENFEDIIENIPNYEIIVRDRFQTRGFGGNLILEGTINIDVKKDCGKLCVLYFTLTRNEKLQFNKCKNKLSYYKNRLKSFKNYKNFEDFNDVGKGVIIFNKEKELIYKFKNKSQILNKEENYIKLLHHNNHYTIISNLKKFKNDFCILCFKSHEPNIHKEILKTKFKLDIDSKQLEKITGVKTLEDLYNAEPIIVMYKRKIVGTSRNLDNYKILQLEPLGYITKDKPYCKNCDGFRAHKRCSKNNDFIQPVLRNDFSSFYDKGKLNIKYFAYDIESTITNNKHHFSLLVIQELYQDKQLIFNNLDKFFDYIKTLKYTSYFFAHNASGYDSYILISHLIKNSIQPTNVVSVGQKIIKFKYRKATFCDSMRHLPMSLNAAAKTYQLKESKSFFPYEFYTKNNKYYKGIIPDIKYFNIKLKEYLKIYTTNYNIHKECIKYCKLDVKLLANVLQNYRDHAIKINNVDPLQCLTIASYALKVYRVNHLQDNLIANLKGHSADFARKAFYGGRTEVFKTYYEGEMQYLDINSLYPYVQKTKELPIGIPMCCKENSNMTKNISRILKSSSKSKIAQINALIQKPRYTDEQIDKVLSRGNLTKEEIEYRKNEYKKLNKLYNVFIIDLEFESSNLYIPLIGYKNDNKFIFNNQAKRVQITNFELYKAIELNYKVKKVYEIHLYQSSKTLFNSYINKYEKIKNQAKKDNNTGMYHLSKLMLNSLWGKFGQRNIQRKCVYLRNKEEWVRLIIRERMSKNIRIMNYKEENNLLKVQYDEFCIFTNTNAAIATFVTSHARLKLYEGFEAVGLENMIYCDTDSMIFKFNKFNNNQFNQLNNLKNLIGDEFGQWKDETNGDKLVKFCGIGPKSYSFETKSGYRETKCKGFITKLSFEDLERIVKEDKKISVPHTIFKRKEGKITTDKGEKVVSMNFNKRNLVGFNTLPK